MFGSTTLHRDKKRKKAKDRGANQTRLTPKKRKKTPELTKSKW